MIGEAEIVSQEGVESHPKVLLEKQVVFDREKRKTSELIIKRYSIYGHDKDNEYPPSLGECGVVLESVDKTSEEGLLFWLFDTKGEPEKNSVFVTPVHHPTKEPVQIDEDIVRVFEIETGPKANRKNKFKLETNALELEVEILGAEFTNGQADKFQANFTVYAKTPNSPTTN